jgi:hypothetical protein
MKRSRSAHAIEAEQEVEDHDHDMVSPDLRVQQPRAKKSSDKLDDDRDVGVDDVEKLESKLKMIKQQLAQKKQLEAQRDQENIWQSVNGSFEKFFDEMQDSRCIRIPRCRFLLA